MRILITNESLDQRGGSDLFVRDLGRELNRRGHSVIAYSSALSERERSLERDVIPVATDLERLPVRPDVIHARHHLDAMSAVMALPETPAIYHCLRPTSTTAVPQHPRIYKTIAPSRAAARTLSSQSGIDASAIEVLLNGVDLGRFRHIRRSAERPTRGLVYDAHLSASSPLLGPIRTATAELGLELAVIGRRAGVDIDNPEVRLPAYDVVFATGRAAIEALACGCAVIVLGEAGGGEMVREENFERLREADFVAGSGFDSVGIRRELERYSAASCASIADRIRQEADFVRYVDIVERIYRDVVAVNGQTAADLDLEQRYASDYLLQLVPFIKEMDESLKRGPGVSFATASLLLDVKAKQAALQAEFDKPRW